MKILTLLLGMTLFLYSSTEYETTVKYDNGEYKDIYSKYEQVIVPLNEKIIATFMELKNITKVIRLHISYSDSLSQGGVQIVFKNTTDERYHNENHLSYTIHFEHDTENNLIVGKINRVNIGGSENLDNVLSLYNNKNYTKDGLYTDELPSEMKAKELGLYEWLLIIWILINITRALIKTFQENGRIDSKSFALYFIDFIFLLSVKSDNSSSSKKQKSKKVITNVTFNKGTARVKTNGPQGNGSFSFQCDEIINWTENSVTFKRYNGSSSHTVTTMNSNNNTVDSMVYNS